MILLINKKNTTKGVPSTSIMSPKKITPGLTNIRIAKLLIKRPSLDPVMTPL